MRHPYESITIQLQIVLVSYPVWDAVLIKCECGEPEMRRRRDIKGRTVMGPFAASNSQRSETNFG